MPKGQTPKTRMLRKTTATVNKILKTPQSLGLPASLRKHGKLKKISKLLGRSMSKGKGK